jgi:hypothetical protein
MSVTITSAGLIAAYPEWANAPSGVIDNAVSVANAKPLQLYTDSYEETDRRYLEASAILFTKPFARDMRRPKDTRNHYREEATKRDVLKGTAYRAPGWTLPSGVV